MVICDTLVTMSMIMKSSQAVPAGEFKAKCLALLDEVERKNRRFVVTKRGRPVAQVIPLASNRGSLLGTVLYEEDLLAPVDAVWEATR